MTPTPDTDWKTRLAHLGLSVLAVVFGFYVIVMAGVPLEASRNHLPEPLHLVVLALYTSVLAYLLSWIATERGRKRNLPKIIEWFGPNGLLLLPLFLMAISALVLASLTATLYDHGWIQLFPGSRGEVTESALKDFYLWHLLDLVPFVEIPETLRWDEPVRYAQTRVGWLVLLYQAVVVVPSIGAIGWYWKRREELRRSAAEDGRLS